jgi:hypothetical protein
MQAVIFIRVCFEPKVSFLFCFTVFKTWPPMSYPLLKLPPFFQSTLDTSAWWDRKKWCLPIYQSIKIGIINNLYSSKSASFALCYNCVLDHSYYVGNEQKTYKIIQDIWVTKFLFQYKDTPWGTPGYRHDLVS